MIVFRQIKALLSLLTRIPLRGQSIEEAAKVFYLVPLVGIIEGAIVVVVLVLPLWLNIDSTLISALSLLTHTLITGGIHIDGLADYSDVIGSLKRGDRALEVLKDPRKGSFAIIAISLRMIIGLVSLSTLISTVRLKVIPTILTLYIASAEAMFITCYFGNEEPYEGIAKHFSKHSKNRVCLIRNFLCYAALSALTVVLSGVRYITIIILLTPIVIGFLVSYDANRRLGFVNGDVLGFSYELVNTSTLLLAATLASAGWLI
ncbi:MAG: adenosylcobinamide-GDP ribazoletransferase [Sulfolobales archaeon]